MYLVATAVVGTQQDSRLVKLAGAVVKPETLTIPMIFLYAILEKDLGRFALVARDAGYSTWEVSGTKPVRLPNDLISEDKSESLMELEKRIANSGYLEAVQGLIRLEEEKGISCTEALDTCEELLE